ncbi:hypothetical protein ILUMI_10802 [Ignelater luminosus]|uniref:Single domain-containing protein n=1 Tax=Ignelater luminosus TaxID=2038154 RepID=A0A8K0CZP8_IGNLU|nr:hypothetical protein ILUMI_10802 [Ignelater luminosus]
MFKVFVFIVVVVAAVACLPASNDAIYKPGYCRIKDVYIKEGEEGPGPIGQCMRIKCVNAQPGHEQFSGVGCGTFVPRKGCHLSDYDDTKRYPACCPREVCPADFEDNKL